MGKNVKIENFENYQIGQNGQYDQNYKNGQIHQNGLDYQAS